MSATANIVLTGFMGTGKSVVGQLVAQRTERAFVDTDALIEERHGPIPEIFELRGEPHFRRLEREIVRELAERDDLVIATGGGTMVDEPSAMMLLSAGCAVYTLTAAPAEIVRRVEADGVEARPLLAGDDPAGRVTALLREREHAYGRFIQVRTDGRTPESIAGEIANDARNRGVVATSSEPSRAARMGGNAFVVVLFAVAVIALGVAVFALARASDNGGPLDHRIASGSGEAPSSAPDADAYVALEPAEGTASDLLDRIEDQVDGSSLVVGDSVIGLATVASDAGPFDFVAWDEISAVPGEVAELSTCTGLFSSSAHVSSCRETASAGPTTASGTLTGVEGLQNWLKLDFGPPEARWVVVETNRGFRILSDALTVDAFGSSFSFAEWAAIDGAATRILVLDDALTEIWSADVAEVI